MKGSCVCVCTHAQVKERMKVTVQYLSVDHEILNLFTISSRLSSVLVCERPYVCVCMCVIAHMCVGGGFETPEWVNVF